MKENTECCYCGKELRFGLIGRIKKRIMRYDFYYCKKGCERKK